MPHALILTSREFEGQGTFLLVWMTVKRGKKPCAMACLTIWKAALMSAWLAMIAASVASTNMGKKVPSGSESQKLVP